MKYLLLGGAQSVGKTETIYRTAEFLLRTKAFSIHSGSIPANSGDFTAVLEGKDNTGATVFVLLNGATDTPGIIQNLVDFIARQTISIDVIISSVRDNSYTVRQDFFRMMNVTSNDFILEIPMAKITRQGGNFPPAIAWYRQTLDNLIEHSLASPPFSI